ncbi:TetR/AcrR family transcriptional regulator [Desulfogranum japonicum]|uniref:TetR/AcrR family transcriptional regulator n=1 Tax=Desulfogranum japonicum TaxID=231447 RepID=UPI00041290D0|nr:TetR/AcrR family transcriptional regulator [Desulfogranum japonicum]
MAKAQFNREEIIYKVTELFWNHGYSGSSMQQVVKVTGLKPGSIYYSFGNKEALFKEALENYAQKRLMRIRRTLDGASSVGKGICHHLDRLVNDAAAHDFRSCFLVKTQLELAGEGNELYAHAAAKLAEMEALFQQYLEREYDLELSQSRATSIMLHSFGLRVYGYQKNPEKRMRLALRQGLPWLPWDEKVVESKELKFRG